MILSTLQQAAAGMLHPFCIDIGQREIEIERLKMRGGAIRNVTSDGRPAIRCTDDDIDDCFFPPVWALSMRQFL